MSDLQTAFYWEDLDELRMGFNYMAAVKLLKENGISVEGLTPLGNIQSYFIIEGATAILERYLTVSYENPVTSGGKDEGEDPSAEYEDEFYWVWVRTGEVDREKLSDMVAGTMGESLFDIEFSGPWLKLIFYPGVLPDPTPLQAAAFVVAFQKEWGLCKAA